MSCYTCTYTGEITINDRTIKWMHSLISYSNFVFLYLNTIFFIYFNSLTKNSIGDEGAIAISEGLKTMVDLQVLR